MPVSKKPRTRHKANNDSSGQKGIMINNTNNTNDTSTTEVPQFCPWYDDCTKKLSDQLFLPHVFEGQSINIDAYFKFPPNSNHYQKKDCFKIKHFQNNSNLSNYYNVLQYYPPQENTSSIDTHIKMNSAIKNQVSKIFSQSKSKIKRYITPNQKIIDDLKITMNDLKQKNITYQKEVLEMIDNNHIDIKILQKINTNIIKLNEDIDNEVKRIKEIKINGTNNTDYKWIIDSDIKTIKDKYEKKFIEITHASKCKKVKINFTQNQKEIILKWSKECDRVYDACVDIFNNDRYHFNKDYKKFKLFVFEKLYGIKDNKINVNKKEIHAKNDSEGKNKKKDKGLKVDKNKKSKGVPYDTLTDIVKEFCTNVQSCETNMENKSILKYEMGLKNPKRQHISLCITKANIKINGFYTSILGPIENFESIYSGCNINRDCRLIYDKYFKIFHLCIPYYVNLIRTNKVENDGTITTKLISETKLKKLKSEPTKVNLKISERIAKDVNDKRQKYCALDPGEKIFQTFYGETSCGTLGSDLRDIILNYRGIIGKYKRILKKGVNKEGQRLKNSTRKFLRKKMRFIYEKIKNITSELHNKTCLFLCKNFNTILIPKFQTQSMLKKNKRATYTYKEKDESKQKESSKASEDSSQSNQSTKKEVTEQKPKNKLPKKVKFVLSMQGHFKFRTKLIEKAKDYQCQVHVVTEEYTSMCCGKCGYLSKNYNESRVKKCSNCKHEIDRDINGARNILLKNKDLIFKKSKVDKKEVSLENSSKIPIIKKEITQGEMKPKRERKSPSPKPLDLSKQGLSAPQTSRKIQKVSNLKKVNVNS